MQISLSAPKIGPYTGSDIVAKRPFFTGMNVRRVALKMKLRDSPSVPKGKSLKPPNVNPLVLFITVSMSVDSSQMRW
jgi:hypothetical protein